MPQVDFFAAREDQLALLGFLYAATDLRVFEHASRPDADLREFRSPDEVDAAFRLGDDRHGNGRNVGLALWSPSVMPPLDVKRITFDPAFVRGASYRYAVEGWGLMQLSFGGTTDGVVTKSHFGHNSEARARAWGHEHGVDWAGLMRLSRRTQSRIRRMAAMRVPGRPVLPHAAALWREGYRLKEFVGAPSHWESTGLCPDA